VRRYLVGEPLEAGPESASYRFKKLVRRNKGPFIAAALIALALIGGIIGTTIFAVRAAENARIAEARAEELKQVADFQSEQFAGIDVAAMGWSLRSKMLEELALEPSDVVGADFTGAALKLLNEHVFEGTHAAINEQFADQPLVRAQLLQSLATTLLELGLLEEVTDPQETALRLRRGHLGDEHPDTLGSINNMGLLLKNQGKYEEALSYYTEALEGLRRVVGDEHPSTLSSINNMGILLKNQGKYEEALPYYTEALETRRRVLGDEHPSTLRSINNMGVVLNQLGKHEEALPYYTEALEGRRRVLGDEHPSTLASIKSMIKLFDAWHEAEPIAGHDVTAAEYRAMLEAIEAEMAEADKPAVP
jgi:tetratricopeptide (TPR) repeat protein